MNVQSKFTQQQITGVINTLLEGIALTGIVMLFFLGSWRNMIVVLIAIPASLCVALFVMKMMGLTLDTISLLGMTLVVGILVDDSTVVLENIERHHAMGQPPDEAAINGRNEIGMAAVVITLVDVVVFLPIAFMQGQVGRNLAEFAIVVVISTLTSLFVSFTITPSLAANWALRGHWKPFGIIRAFTRGFERVRWFYAHRILPWGLRHRVPFVAACFASLVFAISLVTTGIVGSTFIPPVYNGQVFVQVTYPVGTPLTTTTTAVLKLEHQLRSLPQISRRHRAGGRVLIALWRAAGREQRRADPDLPDDGGDGADAVLGEPLPPDRGADAAEHAGPRHSGDRAGRRQRAAARRARDGHVRRRPDTVRAKGVRRDAAHARRDQREQQRGVALAAGAAVVPAGEDARSRRERRDGDDGGAGGLRRRDRDAVREPARPHPSAGDLSARPAQRSLDDRPDPDSLEQRADRPSRRFHHLPVVADAGADHARQPQHRHRRRRPTSRRTRRSRTCRPRSSSASQRSICRATSWCARARSGSRTSWGRRCSAWGARSSSRSCSSSC